MFLKYCVICLMISSIIAEGIVQKTDVEVAESGRHLNDYITQSTDISGWMPQYHTDELPSLRRRIRKRKRRPPMISLMQINDKIPIRSQTGDEIIEKIRRKSTPIYDENRQISQKIRDPFTALKEAESKQKPTYAEFTTTTTTIPVDLKTILKQSDGSSLSEILQKKNLTLSELLTGNRKAISALIEKTPTTTTTTTTETIQTLENGRSATMKYKNNLSDLRKATNRNYEQINESVESITSGEVLDAQRKRLALLHKTNDNQIYKFEVVTEQTTERRIFIPQIEQIRPTSKSNLPITSAKLNKLLITKQPSTTLPPNAIKIDINEIFGIKEQIKKTNNDDGPLRMTIDIDNMFENTTISSMIEENTTITTINNVKWKSVTAQEELMEILKNPIDRESLSRILQIRNMTIDELVQQRERGSSQLHLADIFHNHTREPEPEGEISVSYIPEEYFDNFPSRQSKNQRFPSVVKKELKNPTVNETTPTTTTTSKPLYTITNFPTYKIESNKNVDGNQSILGPIWRQFYTNINADFYKNTTTTTTAQVPTVPPIFNDFDDVPNNFLDTEILNQQFNDENSAVEDAFIILPSGVKSAILASFAIIGGSLFVFLTILMIFKWNQRQKNRLNNGSFSRSKLRTAILESQHKHRTLRTFMNETLGRKKNYYKTHSHNSMSDSIWDNDQKLTF